MPIAIVEDLVAREYRSIRIRGGLADELQRQLRREFETAHEELLAERSRQQQRATHLEAERDKLLQAFYAGALPLDLLKREQDRISRELTVAAGYSQAADDRLRYALGTLEDALALAQDCYRAYCLAEPQLRRQFNQVFFTQLLVTDDETVDGQLANPFRLLLTPETHRKLRGRATTVAELGTLSEGWPTPHVVGLPPNRTNP